MWPDTYSQRLRAWVDLRDRAGTQPLDDSLININDWWMRAPLVNRYLYWDDHRSWPTVWELLVHNHYCELARAVGMLYTLLMLDRKDIVQLELIDTNQGNLVRVNEGKYILNWAQGEILNIHSNNITIYRSISGSQLSHLLG